MFSPSSLPDKLPLRAHGQRHTPCPLLRVLQTSQGRGSLKKEPILTTYVVLRSHFVELDLLKTKVKPHRKVGVRPGLDQCP